MKKIKYLIPYYGAVLYSNDAYKEDYQRFLKSDRTSFKNSTRAWQKVDLFMGCLGMHLALYIQLPLMVWLILKG